MQTAKDYFRLDDAGYIIAIRREIHQHPEIGFDLPNTVAIVKRELDAIGVQMTCPHMNVHIDK